MYIMTSARTIKRFSVCKVKRVSFTFIIHVLADDFFNIFYRNERFRIT